MITKDAEAELRTIVRTLCFQQRATAEMRVRRMYQFQQWLLTPGRDDTANLKVANKVFDSLKASHSATTKLNQHCASGKIRPSEAVEFLLKSDPLFRRDFDRAYLGYEIPDPLVDASDYSGSAACEVVSVNIFTHFCIQLHESNKKGSKGLARQLYARAASHNKEIIKDVEKLRTERRSRLAFLYIAERLHPWFLHRPPEQAQIYEYLTFLSENRERMQPYFAKCAYVQSVLANKSELAADRIAAWAGVDILPLPDLDVLSDAEIEAAERFDVSRRRKSHKGRLPSEEISS